ncbi:MAG: hypothetical protein ACRBBT_03400 [Paracoccaceae bacterium]
MSAADLTRDHVALTDGFAARRYFAKFEAITAHMGRVAAQMRAEGRLDDTDVDILGRYQVALGFTFKALALKYLMTGKASERFLTAMSFDAVESGFPVAAELLVMANDAMQAERHLAQAPSAAQLKADMVQKITSDYEVPVKLQYALSQRLYYEELAKGGLFWARNDPEAIWIENSGEGRDLRRRYVLHWAVYDSQYNLPAVYIMEVEDSGKYALARDQRRWPEVQSHLMGQALGGLKLLTIAKGFDESFDDLHPKRLRRFHLGPMYSHAFTRQSGPIAEVLASAKAPMGQDWAMAWTLEELLSEKVREERAGWLSTVEREVYALDPFSGRGADTGATSTERMIILPERPYQALEEMRPAGFESIRKFVVSPQGRVLSYR